MQNIIKDYPNLDVSVPSRNVVYTVEHEGTYKGYKIYTRETSGGWIAYPLGLPVLPERKSTKKKAIRHCKNVIDQLTK